MQDVIEQNDTQLNDILWKDSQQNDFQNNGVKSRFGPVSSSFKILHDTTDPLPKFGPSLIVDILTLILQNVFFSEYSIKRF